jgi:hypothetical protein
VSGAFFGKENDVTELKLWSYRNSPTQGWHWLLERNVDEGAHARLALDCSRAEEPDVSFLVSKSQPIEVPR